MSVVDHVAGQGELSWAALGLIVAAVLVVLAVMAWASFGGRLTDEMDRADRYRSVGSTIPMGSRRPSGVVTVPPCEGVGGTEIDGGDMKGSPS